VWAEGTDETAEEVSEEMGRVDEMPVSKVDEVLNQTLELSVPIELGTL